MKKHIYISIKCYADYFAILIKSDTAVGYYELSENNQLPIEALSKVMMSYTSIIFDYNLHDISLLSYALSGANNEQINNLSIKISSLNEQDNIFELLCQENININKEWDYINLNGALGGSDKSLLLYAARMHKTHLMLPPNRDSNATNFGGAVKLYCQSMCDTLESLHAELSVKMNLRIAMSIKSGINLNSCTDAKIAEECHRAALGNIRNSTSYDKLRYIPPSNITLNTRCLAELSESLASYQYRLDSDGKLVNSKDQPNSVIVGGNEYKLGLGGLHSTEKSRAIVAEDGEFLVEVDVISYYPAIILANKYAPPHLGNKFLGVYNSFLDNRLKAIKDKNSDAADIYKIIINGVFGKFGSKYSILYAPELLLQTTLTGQLYLLMLIETLHAYGFEVVSANTDGLVIKGRDEDKSKLTTLLGLWQSHTSFNLKTNYMSALYSESVNSYIAIYTSGEVKCKGSFADEAITRNPFSNICKKAVLNYIQDGTPIVDTVLAIDNLQTDFLNVSTSKHGIMYDGIEQSTVSRWYYAKHNKNMTCSKTGGKISKTTGATVIMDLSDNFVDIDYPRYVSESYELLSKLGVDKESE